MPKALLLEHDKNDPLVEKSFERVKARMSVEIKTNEMGQETQNAYCLF